MNAIVNSDMKCEFANLVYEKLLTEKYFIETCFSKKYNSYSPKEKLFNLRFKIDINESFK